MKSKLLNKVDKDNRAELKQSFVASQYYRKTLIAYLEGLVEEAHTAMRKDSLENPNWAISQAQKVAEVRAYKRVVELLSESV